MSLREYSDIMQSAPEMNIFTILIHRFSRQFNPIVRTRCVRGTQMWKIWSGCWRQRRTAKISIYSSPLSSSRATHAALLPFFGCIVYFSYYLFRRHREKCNWTISKRLAFSWPCRVDTELLLMARSIEIAYFKMHGWRKESIALHANMSHDLYHLSQLRIKRSSK